MNMRDLMPWTRGSDPAPDFYREDRMSGGFATLQREINRLFEDLLRGFEAPSLLGRRQGLTTMGWPRIEVNESDKEISVSAELPGLEEKNVELLINDGVLIIRGEKKAEAATEEKNQQFSECFYGRFERQIPLGHDIDEDKVEASFKNGVLKVTAPRSAQAQTKMKRIEINAPTKH